MLKFWGLEDYKLSLLQGGKYIKEGTLSMGSFSSEDCKQK